LFQASGPLFWIERISLVLPIPLIYQPSFKKDILLLMLDVTREVAFPESADVAATNVGEPPISLKQFAGSPIRYKGMWTGYVDSPKANSQPPRAPTED